MSRVVTAIDNKIFKYGSELTVKFFIYFENNVSEFVKRE